MKRLVFPEMKTAKGYKLGVWSADCPTFRADEDYRVHLIGQLMPEFRHERRRAEAEADKRIDDLCRMAYVHTLREFVRRLADTYARRFPLKIQGKTLLGFDPEHVARFYQPYRDHKGRPDPRLDNLLAEMARNAPSFAQDRDSESVRRGR